MDFALGDKIDTTKTKQNRPKLGAPPLENAKLNKQILY
jgi:hypothetical protein